MSDYLLVPPTHRKQLRPPARYRLRKSQTSRWSFSTTWRSRQDRTINQLLITSSSGLRQTIIIRFFGSDGKFATVGFELAKLSITIKRPAALQFDLTTSFQKSNSQLHDPITVGSPLSNPIFEKNESFSVVVYSCSIISAGLE